MKLLILSDLHIEWAGYYLPGNTVFDVAILAGDISNRGDKSVRTIARRLAALGKRVILVPGNHEFYDCNSDFIQEEMSRMDTQFGVDVLNHGEVIIEGVRFLGCTLWTDFELPFFHGEPHKGIAMSYVRRRMNDFRFIHSRSKRWTIEDALERHQLERAWLLDKLQAPFEGKTVVVTHHAPSIESVPTKYREDELSPAYASALPSVFFETPVLWVHGHIHDSKDYRVGNTRVVSNPRGYRNRTPRGLWRKDFENKNFNPGLVVEI